MHYWVNQFAVTPDTPGGTRHYDFAARLGRLGVSTAIMAADVNLGTRQYTRRRGPWDRRAIVEHMDGVPFHWLHTLTYESNDWRRSLGMLRFAQSVLHRLLRVPVDRDTVFIGSSPTLFAALATQAAARIRRVRFVLEIRDLWPESLIEMTGRNGAIARGLRVIADHLYRTSSQIIVLADKNRDAIAARGVPDDRFIYIPNSVDTDAFAHPRPSPAAQTLPDDRFCVVYAGAHGPANDLGTAIEAAALLRDRGDRVVHLVLVGDGVEKTRLRDLARQRSLDNVSFLDPIPKSEIPGLFARCHAGLLTLEDIPLFRYGVSPNKLFDYMAAGLPVITNVAGECGDIVRRAGCGWVAKPGDPAALADALAEAASAQNGERAEAGRAFVGEHFNRDRLVHRLAEVIQGV